MMKALETAKTMAPEEIREKIIAAGLREYGVFREPLSQKWEELFDECDGSVSGVAAGLNNSDTKHALLGLLKTHADDIFQGIALTALALGAEEKILILPENETELADELQSAAGAYGITVKNEFIPVREYRTFALHHIETMLAAAQILDGSYVPGTYVCAAGEELTFVPCGTKLADAVSLDGAKAVEVSTRLYTPAAAAELVIDEELSLGDGVITLLDDKKCLMQECEARLLANRIYGCGKCTFCREGMNQIYAHITDITSGKGKKEALAMVEEIGKAMGFSCACSVGCTAADFVIDSMNSFMDEYDAHIKKRKCPAGVCTCFMTIYVDPQACKGNGDCMDVCPNEAIEGKSGYISMIDEFECSKCGKCIDACEEGAIISTTGRVPKLPTRLTKVGKFKKKR